MLTQTHRHERTRAHKTYNIFFPSSFCFFCDRSSVLSVWLVELLVEDARVIVVHCNRLHVVGSACNLCWAPGDWVLLLYSSFLSFSFSLFFSHRLFDRNKMTITYFQLFAHIVTPDRISSWSLKNALRSECRFSTRGGKDEREKNYQFWRKAEKDEFVRGPSIVLTFGNIFFHFFRFLWMITVLCGPFLNGWDLLFSHLFCQRQYRIQ